MELIEEFNVRKRFWGWMLKMGLLKIKENKKRKFLVMKLGCLVSISFKNQKKGKSKQKKKAAKIEINKMTNNTMQV